MGRIWNALVAHATDKIGKKIKEIQEAPSNARERLEHTLRETGVFGEHLVGEASRYDPALLTDLPMGHYFATAGRKPEDYTFELPIPVVSRDGSVKMIPIKPFPIQVYVPKDAELVDAVAIELRKLTDKGKIPDIEYLASVGLVERIHYQASGGQGVPEGRSMLSVLQGDYKKVSGKEAGKVEPNAKGAVYSVMVTPMVPKVGPAYTEHGTVPILLAQDAKGVYRPVTGVPGIAPGPTPPPI